MTTKEGSQSDALNNAAADNTTALNPIVGIQPEELIRAFGVVLRESTRQPSVFQKHITNYMRDMMDIMSGKSEFAPEPKDKRFRDTAWETNPFYRVGLQSWLAMRKNMMNWVNDVPAEDDDKARAQFVMDIAIDSFAPTNSLVGNPAAMKKMYETGGKSVVNGLKNAYDDLVNNKGMPSQVDKRPFKIGENIVTSEGAVVYRSEMLELIQYKPLTPNVHAKPLLMVPPQINKFYVSDLTPEKSIFKFLLDRGFQLFAISWRNPTKEHAHWGMQQYIESLLEVIGVVTAITKSPDLNICGACSGGITTATLLSHMAATDDKRVNAITLEVCVLDPQSDDSEVGLFVSDRTIELARERSAKQGVLAGDDLARMFAWLRPNDLIWNYVINNYLLGEAPPPFDILFWNNDSTNLPAALHSDYLDISSDERFAKPGTVEFMGHPIDLSKVTQDCFMVAGTTDHITPWRACYRTTQLLGGKIDFILSNSGHIQALLNPPGNPKSKFFTNKDLPPSPDAWLEGTTENAGSWWETWTDWLAAHSGDEKPAPKKLGNTKHKPLGKAPGEYVFSQAHLIE